MAGLDLQHLLKLLLGNFTFWESSLGSPDIGPGLPSAHAMVSGAFVALHPQLFLYSIAVMLSRVLMKYNTPFQCAVGYLLGGTLVANVKKVLRKREYLPVLCLAMGLRMLIKNEFFIVCSDIRALPRYLGPYCYTARRTLM